MIALNHNQLATMADYIGNNLHIFFEDGTDMIRKIDYQLISVFERQAMLRDVKYVNLMLRPVENMRNIEAQTAQAYIGYLLGDVIRRQPGVVTIDILDRPGSVRLDEGGVCFISTGINPRELHNAPHMQLVKFMRNRGFIFGHVNLPIERIEEPIEQPRESRREPRQWASGGVIPGRNPNIITVDEHGEWQRASRGGHINREAGARRRSLQEEMERERVRALQMASQYYPVVRDTNGDVRPATQQEIEQRYRMATETSDPGAQRISSIETANGTIRIPTAQEIEDARLRYMGATPVYIAGDAITDSSIGYNPIQGEDTVVTTETTITPTETRVIQRRGIPLNMTPEQVIETCHLLGIPVTESMRTSNQNQE